MSNEDDVLINFIGDTSQLQPVTNALESIIAQSGEVGAAWNKASATMNAGTKTQVEGSNKLVKGIEALATAAKSMDKAVIGAAYAKYLKDIQTQLGLANKEVVSFIQNARNAAQQQIFAAKTDAEIDEITLSIEAMNEQLKFFGAIEDETSGKTQTLRARIREAKVELVAMAEAGLQGTPAFIALQDKAGELDDQMRDLNASVKNVGSDTRNIDGLISLVGGVAGGFAVAQGAAALFGNENEEVQRALLKVNSAMAILQGLQQIVNTLQKENAAVQLVSRVRTNAMAASQQFLTATTLQSAAATNVLRGALLASGVGAIVVLLGLAVQAFSAFSDETDNAAQSANDFADSIDNLNVSLDDTINKTKQNGELQLEYIKQRGGSEKDLHEKTIDFIKMENDAIKDNNQKKIDGINSALESTGIFGKGLVENKDQADDLVKSLKKISSSLPDQNGQKKTVDAAIDALKTVSTNYQKIADNEAGIILKNEQFKTKTITDEAGKRKDQAKKSSEETREIAAANAAAIFDINKRALEREIDFRKKQADSEPSSLGFRLEGLQKFYDASEQLITLEREKELSARKLTALQVANINDKYDKESLDAKKAFGDAKIEILKQNAEKERLIDEQFRAQLAADEKAKEETATNSVNTMFSSLAANLSNAQEQRLAAAEQQYNAGLISVEDYEAKRNQISKEGAKTEIANEIQRLKSIISIRQSFGLDITEQQKALNDAADSLRAMDIAKHEESEKKKSEISAKEQAVRSALINGAGQLLQEGLSSMFEAQAQERQAAFEEVLQKLKDARDEELNNKNLTEEQKAVINKKYADKERQIKIEAFKADKAAKIEQAIANGFLAVTNALATVKPFLPFALIAAGVAAASTAIQVSNISRMKVPKFKQGKIDIYGPGTTTSDSIPAMISRGESVINADATAKWKEALQAINSNKFEHYLLNKIPEFIFPQLPVGFQAPVNNSMHIDYDKLSTAIAEKMKGVIPGEKHIEVINDSNGQRVFVKETNSRTEYKNKRYSMT